MSDDRIVAAFEQLKSQGFPFTVNDDAEYYEECIELQQTSPNSKLFVALKQEIGDWYLSFFQRFDNGNCVYYSRNGRFSFYNAATHSFEQISMSLVDGKLVWRDEPELGLTNEVLAVPIYKWFSDKWILRYLSDMTFVVQKPEDPVPEVPIGIQFVDIPIEMI